MFAKHVSLHSAHSLLSLAKGGERGRWGLDSGVKCGPDSGLRLCIRLLGVLPQMTANQTAYDNNSLPHRLGGQESELKVSGGLAPWDTLQDSRSRLPSWLPVSTTVLRDLSLFLPQPPLLRSPHPFLLCVPWCLQVAFS